MVPNNDPMKKSIGLIFNIGQTKLTIPAGMIGIIRMEMMKKRSLTDLA